MSPQPPRAGLYGKIPSRGDFVRWHLPPGFAGPWDAWLQAALAESRAALADRWLACFLNAPVWRFFLTGGICGSDAAAGVLIPSVDSVGRYFPLAIVAAAKADTIIPHAAAAAADWFDAAEALALDHLDPRADIEALAERLRQLGPPVDADPAVEAVVPAASAGREANGNVTALVRLRLSEMSPRALIGEVCPASLDHIVRMAYRRYSMWWTSGADCLPPTVTLYAGLPPARDFAELLGGAAAPNGHA